MGILWQKARDQLSDLTVYDKIPGLGKTNLDKAKELMKEAGLEDGVTLTLITHNASGYYQKIAEILANQLGRRSM